MQFLVTLREIVTRDAIGPIIAKLTDYMTTNIPFMIMSNNFSLYALLTLFISIIIVQILTAIINNLRRSTYTIRIYERNSAKGYESMNVIYKNIGCYLTHNNNNTDRTSLTSSYSMYDPKLMTHVPMYTADNNLQIDGVNVKHVTAEIKYFIITASKQHCIDSFMAKIIKYDKNSKYNGEIAYKVNYNSYIKTIRLNNPKDFNNIFLKKADQEFIISKVDTFLKSEELYKDKCIAYKIGFVLYGKDLGTGKSSTYYSLSKYFSMPIYFLDMTAVLSVQLDEIRSKSIVVIEELDLHSVFHAKEKQSKTKSKKCNKKLNNIQDKISSDNTDNSEEQTESDEDSDNDNYRASSNSKPGLSNLLSMLDGVTCLYGCIVIITTNRIHKLDGRILRPGRIDHKIEYTNCDLYQLNCILNYYYDCDDILSDDIKQKLIGNISPATLVNQFILGNINNIDQFVNSIYNTFAHHII